MIVEKEHAVHPALHVGIDASNIRVGGGITHLSQLLQVGQPGKSGIDRVTVWANQSTLDSLPETPWLKKRNSPWMEKGILRRIVAQQLLLPKEIVKERCDVLFSPGGTLPLKSFLPAIAMSQNMLPFEPDAAAYFGHLSLMRLKLRILRNTQGRSFSRAEGVIFLTNYACQAVSNLLGGIPGSVALIPHGIEPRFRQPPRVQRLLSDCSNERPFKILYVSILMPYKHQVEVAYAARQLRNEGLPVEMRFVGASWGGYGNKFRALLNKLDPRGEFLLWEGAKPFEVLHKYYLEADTFLFASSCENLPNILIEAMAAGLPIASSEKGPMKEVLGDAGVYFDPEVSSSIADAARKLALDAPLRFEIASAAWEKSRAYSWERCANDTFDFLAKIGHEHMK